MINLTRVATTQAIHRIAALRGNINPIYSGNSMDLFDSKGLRFVVTGAAGSIGSTLVRRLLRDACSVVAFDQDETGLQRLVRKNDNRRLVPWLANLRDKYAVDRLFRDQAVDVVIHCAALKHVDLLEAFPREALLTNILGTENILAAAHKKGCTFINLSTDKAASVKCVLGYSKRITERLVAWYARQSNSRTVTVRLGNVLGSRGSVLELFINRALTEDTLPITDPLMTRYFMTLDEVINLIFAAAADDYAGRCLVPELGKAIKIGDVARIAIEVTSSRSSTVMIGLRPGDSMHEVLTGPGELEFHCKSDSQSGFSQLDLQPLPSSVVTNLSSLSEEDLVSAMRSACFAKDMPTSTELSMELLT